MSGIRVAATLRELERASPTLLLKALDAKSGLRAAGNQKFGSKTLRAVSFADAGTNFTVLFDPQSKLPAAIRTRDDDNIAGDSIYDLVPSDWKAVGGVKVAHTLTYQLNGVDVGKVTYKEVTANPTITADTFAVPEAVKSAAKAPATGNVPYQWVLRRLALGRFLDSDGIIVPPGGSLKLVELAPKVQHDPGRTYKRGSGARHRQLWTDPFGSSGRERGRRSDRQCKPGRTARTRDGNPAPPRARRALGPHPGRGDAGAAMELRRPCRGRGDRATDADRD